MIPKPACRYGYTEEQVEEIVGDRLEEFHVWFRGQTGAICDGGKFYNTGCGPHGAVVYAHDLERFLSGV